MDSAVLTATRGHSATRWTESLVERANRPVAADSVAIFRIGFGMLVALSTVRFIANGWVETLYLSPENHLTYRFFEWVEPWPAPIMYLHMVVLAVSGLAIAAGYRHRLAAMVFLVLFVYAELIDAALYLNHYWFMTLAGILLLVLPVHHHWSLDARSGRVEANSHIASWVVWTLRAQLAVVYLFAGLAKLNPDWLVRAQPMQTWLADRTGVFLIGPLLDEPVVAYLASWTGALFDSTIVAWLLWRRSRPWAYAVLVFFHLCTGVLFQIGVFPYVMIVSTLVFFDPSWPRQCLRVIGVAPLEVATPVKAPKVRPIVMVGLGVLALTQLVVPLRHYGIASNVRWSEEGYYLSWRVMLTEKAGLVDFRVHDRNSGRSWGVGPELVLTDWQASHAANRPDLIHATANLIADHYAADGLDVEVRADAWVAMNGRPVARLIDPDIDLAAFKRGEIQPADWILPAP